MSRQSCACPAKRGEDCPLTADECLCRTTPSSEPREPQKDETPDAAELLLSLGRIHIAARRALSFGRQATPQTLERMLERRDETLTQIVGACEDAGVKRPSILREVPREPHAALLAEIDAALETGRGFPPSLTKYTVSPDFLRACRAALAGEKGA